MKVEPRPSTVSAAASNGLFYCATLADFVEAFTLHPEVKMVDATGKACRTFTRGLLRPRRVKRRGVYLIGKEVDRISEGVVAAATAEAEDVPVLGRVEVAPPRLIEAIQLLERYPCKQVAGAIQITDQEWRKLRQAQHRPGPLVTRRIHSLARLLPDPAPAGFTAQMEALETAVARIAP